MQYSMKTKEKTICASIIISCSKVLALRAILILQNYSYAKNLILHLMKNMAVIAIVITIVIVAAIVITMN